jgi:hypothetical protein
MDFIVPLHPEDLETRKEGVFSVKRVIDPEDVVDPLELIENVEEHLALSPWGVLSSEVFDPLYSFIK